MTNVFTDFTFSFINICFDPFSDMLSVSLKIFLPVCITFKIIVLFSHYFGLGARKPLITGGKSDKMRKILDKLSKKVSPFHPTVWTYGGNLHTLFGDILRGQPKVNYQYESIVAPDGGVLRLDWTCDDNEEYIGPSKATNSESKVDETHESKTVNPSVLKEVPQKPEVTNIVLILPGLTGDSSSGYALQFAEDALELGYKAVVMNHRGLSTIPTTYRFFCATNWEDLELTLKTIHHKYPSCRICAVGVSIGGMVLTNYLVQKSMNNEETGLAAAFVISIPYDSFKAAKSLEKPVPCFMFNRYLTRKLRHIFVRNVQGLSKNGIKVPEKHILDASKATTIRQFDAAVIAPMFGFRDVDHYYHSASIVEKPIEDIRTPLLFLSAVDDAFSPIEQIPVERIKHCDNVALLLTHTGGHVGFLEGLIPYGRGYMDRVYKHFIQAVFDEG